MERSPQGGGVINESIWPGYQQDVLERSNGRVLNKTFSSAQMAELSTRPFGSSVWPGYQQVLLELPQGAWLLRGPHGASPGAGYHQDLLERLRRG